MVLVLTPVKQRSRVLFFIIHTIIYSFNHYFNHFNISFGMTIVLGQLNEKTFSDWVSCCVSFLNGDHEGSHPILGNLMLYFS